MPAIPQRFPVKLTQAQRKVVAEVAPELADRLKLDDKPQRMIQFTPAELQAIQQNAGAAVHQTSTGMVRNSLRHVIELATPALDRSQGIGAIPASERVYQFKITLKGIAPPIWRRIQVKNCTLDKLHERIQTAMGWTTIQGETWLFCCKQPMTYMGEWANVRHSLPCADQQRTFLYGILDADVKMKDWIWKRTEGGSGSLGVYVFRWAVCGKFKANWDID